MRNELIGLYKMAMADHNDKDIVRAYQRARDRIGPRIVMDEVLTCDEFRARLAEVEAQRDGLKDVLIFIDEECDWEEPKGDFGGGGDPRIGPAIREALAKLEAHDGK